MLANYMKTQKTKNNKLNSISFYSKQQFLFETKIVLKVIVLAFMGFESGFFRKRT